MHTQLSSRYQNEHVRLMGEGLLKCQTFKGQGQSVISANYQCQIGQE